MRKISPQQIARIKAAQKLRWANIKAAKVAPTVALTQSAQSAQSDSPLPGRGSVLITTGTWDCVRHWINAAKMFEQGKLFSQVMTGFELLALQKAHNVVNGNNQHAGRVSHDGKPTEDWETILQKEAGLAQSTAYRYMDMAKAAAPRLKKLPALKNFDPFTTSMATLAEPQREALATAVKKLTDGKSQADFFEELYKGTGGSANPNPEGGRTHKKLSLSEEAALRQECALLDWKAICKILAAYSDKFLVLTDPDVEAQIATLEQALNARKAWLKQPANNRDPRLITEMLERK